MWKRNEKKKRGRKRSDILTLPHTHGVCRRTDVWLGDGQRVKFSRLVVRFARRPLLPPPTPPQRQRLAPPLHSLLSGPLPSVLWRRGRLLSFEMAKNDLVEAPLGVPAAKTLLKRRCQSDVSTPNQIYSFIYLFVYSQYCTVYCMQHFCMQVKNKSGQNDGCLQGSTCSGISQSL